MFQVRMFESKENSPNAAITTTISFSTHIPTSFIGIHHDAKSYQELFKTWIESCEKYGSSEAEINDYYKYLDAINYVVSNNGKLFYILLQNLKTHQTLVLNVRFPKGVTQPQT